MRVWWVDMTRESGMEDLAHTIEPRVEGTDFLAARIW